MRALIFSNWNFMRVLRLVMGIAIIVQAFVVKEVALGLAGLLFTGMAIFNAGCCGTGVCYTPPSKNVQPQKDIDHEEVV